MYQCEICKVTPGSFMAKDIVIATVWLNDASQLSFNPVDPDKENVVVCEKCLKTFGIL